MWAASETSPDWTWRLSLRARDCQAPSHWSQSCDTDETDQLFSVETREQTVSDQIGQFDEWGHCLCPSVRLSAGISFISCTHQHNNNSRLHINSHTWSQQASGCSDWLTVVSLSVFLSNPEACPRSPLTASLRKAATEEVGGSQETLDLCSDTNCV